jgi:uncharacterized protein (DUF4415 family)
MPRKSLAGKPPLPDPDEAPELTDAFFARADIYEGTRLIRRGRPKVAVPKRQVTLRLDAAVVDGLRATGPGWQTLANDALKVFLEEDLKAWREKHQNLSAG